MVSRARVSHTKEQDAFDVFVADHRDAVFRWALAITGSADGAEDAAQEALIRAWRGRGRLREPAALTAWVRRIAVRCALDHAKRRPEPPIPEEWPARHDEVGLAVRQCLAGLHPDLRAILALAYLERLSYREIADALGVPTGTVASRLARAREAFQLSWEDQA